MESASISSSVKVSLIVLISIFPNHAIDFDDTFLVNQVEHRSVRNGLRHRFG